MSRARLSFAAAVTLAALSGAAAGVALVALALSADPPGMRGAPAGKPAKFQDRLEAVPVHQAPTGWAYPAQCCSDRDCRMLPEGMIRVRASGYVVPSGETIGFGDARVKPSPDGRFHWCFDGRRTLCLFAPGGAA